MFQTIPEVEMHCATQIAERGLPEIYFKRLKFEVSEIRKQGADSYWLGLIKDQCRFDKNPNGLVMPWLLGMVDDDPIASRKDPVLTTTKYSKVAEFLASHGKLPAEIIRDSDNPDIDIDCLPEARDPIKDYAVSRYSAGIDDGYGAVCSVGTWQTYLLRSAICDVSKSTGWCDEAIAKALTKELPDEVDDLKDNGEAACKGCKHVHAEAKCPQCGLPDTEFPTIGQLLNDHKELSNFQLQYPDVVDRAVRLVGRIRCMGKHAGALIIADRPLFGNIPMALDTKTKQWKSLWTEGRSTQLSKFGYTKWDILGLKNLRYIYEASRMIEENHGISFGKHTQAEWQFSPGHKVVVPSMSGWDDIDPEENRMGHYYTREGEKVAIDMRDEKVYRMATDARTDAVFQFDTDLAKSILSSGRPQTFNDLLIFNAMGHPGPMAMIPDYVERRGNPDGEWRTKDHPKITEIIGDTCNCIVFQEQLQAMWQNIAGFTAPEAQEARKAVAKKWREKLRGIEAKWMAGASPVLTEALAKEWWAKMETFGRYAFNKSHAVAYCRVAFQCLWLKSHFPHEWWASVMSYCDAKKLVRYMNVARADLVKFVPMDVNNMSMNFAAVPESPRLRHDDFAGGHVMPGLLGLKGIGKKVAMAFVPETVAPTTRYSEDEQGNLLEEAADSTPDTEEEVDGEALGVEIEEEELRLAAAGPVSSLDEFVERKGKNKLLLERLIKLGSFQKFPGHESIRATWEWYRMHYCSGKDITALKKDVTTALQELDGWTEEAITAERERQVAAYKSTFPKRNKIPKKISDWKPTPEVTLERFKLIFPKDYALKELLDFETTFLGYHLHSPLDQYVKRGGCSVSEARSYGTLECVISDFTHTKTKTDKPMCRLTVTDGVQTVPVMIWNDELANLDTAVIKRGLGVRMAVKYDEKRKNFSLKSGSTIHRLKKKDDEA